MFNIPISEAGEGAILSFSFDDLIKLRKEIGEGYASEISKAAATFDADITRKALNIGIKGGDPEVVLRTMPLSEINERIMEALTLRLVGKRVEEATDDA